MRYQLVVLGAAQQSKREALVRGLQTAITNLGLDPKTCFQALDAPAPASVDWDGMPAAVWWGGPDSPDPVELALVQRFVTDLLPVFPVVPDLTKYRKSVPPCLHPINGVEWDQNRLVADLLGAFRLTRRRRRVFISYARKESQGVAVQLFDLSSERGWYPFLDTASVDAGRDFQMSLWSHMANVDMLIFLDSPKALSSRWVHEELARAHDLGLGVLQLVWPGRRRTPGTEFSDCIQLKGSDFEGGVMGMSARLASTVASQVIDQAEISRIRSLNARRLRVVGDLVDQAKLCGLVATVHPVDGIELLRNGRSVARAMPMVGVPDAPAVQQEERRRAARGETRLVYNGLGVSPEWRQHLEWLNGRHRLDTLPVEEAAAWLQGLK